MQDDPSFLPDYALPPPELLEDLDLGFNFDPPRSGESQSLTPFGSQQSSQASHIGGYGLVLPSSSPGRPAGIGLQGDNDMVDIDDLLNLEEPEFMFGDDGDIIEFTPRQSALEAPAAVAAIEKSLMLSDAVASARVREGHEEGQQDGIQVSFRGTFHPFQTALLLASHTRSLSVTRHLLHHAYAFPLTFILRMVSALPLCAIFGTIYLPYVTFLLRYSRSNLFPSVNIHIGSFGSLICSQGSCRRPNRHGPTSLQR